MGRAMRALHWLLLVLLLPGCASYYVDGHAPEVPAAQFRKPGAPPDVQLIFPQYDIKADVVIEAFGCDLPEDFVARMAARRVPPVWINLEYLSAEDYVARSHGLPSPQRNGLVKWFFYPGFDAHSGGLLRERDLLAQREAFDAQAWLASLGLARRAGERVVSLFCYDNPAVPALLDQLTAQPTLLQSTVSCLGGRTKQPFLHTAPCATWPSMYSFALRTIWLSFASV